MRNFLCPRCGSEDYEYLGTLYFCNYCYESFFKPVSYDEWCSKALKEEVAK